MHRTGDYRQHQSRKYHKKAERLVDLRSSYGQPFTEEEKKRIIPHTYHTRVPCSRMCCGNHRKWHGERTYQELKADIEFEQMLEDI